MNRSITQRIFLVLLLATLIGAGTLAQSEGARLAATQPPTAHSSNAAASTNRQAMSNLGSMYHANCPSSISRTGQPWQAAKGHARSGHPTGEPIAN